ncbi:MAG: molybdenum cofactor guanylyltransferase [Proteobacteria bacterium]|jgi:molybdenum cofactor guanylyltransferase|nr:molybdenum cofactor guanylyltransferase [Pseudomonadota bacterium]MDA1301387.1 molybdenum cofactor guanylyltransferase [Pseudomonadota bacterium]
MTDADSGPENVTGIILAGGQSQRMGTADKAWVNYRGTPLLLHVTSALSTQAGHIIISCHMKQPPYTELPYTIVGDETPDFRGPLCGVISTAEYLSTERILVVPCDMPHLPAHLVNRLGEHLKGHEIAVVNDGTRRQHLVFLARRSTILSIRKYVESGKASVAGWIDCHDFVEVDFSDCSDAFANINWPHELEQ